MTDIESIKRELAKLDRIAEKVPDRETIILRIIVLEKKKRQEALKDALMFFAFACLFVTALVQIGAGAPVVFIVLQAAVFVTVPFLAFLDRRRIKRMERWYR